MNEHTNVSGMKRAAGLDDIVATETTLSHVDGLAGRLIIRGRDLEQLADWPFERLLAHLWHDLLPGSPGEEDLRAELGKARELAFTRMDQCLPQTDSLSEIEGLRLLLSTLADSDGTPHPFLVVGAVPVFASALVRRRRGQDAIEPDHRLSHAADFLRMLHGTGQPEENIRALDTYLVTVSDHGLNASTFAARVIASTKAGMISSVIGGLCALKGPLHGGAPGPVLDMLDAIATEDNITSWLASAVERGNRLMGFGHRIYRVRDPRADVLKGAVARLRDGNGRIAFAEKVEKDALRLLVEKKPDRPLQTNVEFYTALLLEALGFPRDSFTNVFAAGRMAGWAAHVMEQEREGRLIRPQSRYIGPMPD